MTGALIILAFTAVAGLGLYLWDVAWRKRNAEGVSGEVAGADAGGSEPVEDTGETGEECCGQHLVCEKTHAAAMTSEVVYYDDEELDRFSGRDADSYSVGEVEEFRDVMLTLLPGDVAGWAHSLDLRKIALPSELRDELLMLIADYSPESKVETFEAGSIN